MPANTMNEYSSLVNYDKRQLVELIYTSLLEALAYLTKHVEASEYFDVDKRTLVNKRDTTARRRRTVQTPAWLLYDESRTDQYRIDCEQNGRTVEYLQLHLTAEANILVTSIDDEDSTSTSLRADALFLESRMVDIEALREAAKVLQAYARS